MKQHHQKVGRFISTIETSADVAKYSKPQFIKGTWRKPALSKRKIAALRKEFKNENKEWEEPNPLHFIKDVPPTPEKRHWRTRPFKGHKHINAKADREAMIQKKLKQMEKLQAQEKKKKEVIKRDKYKGIDFIINPGLLANPIYQYIPEVDKKSNKQLKKERRAAKKAEDERKKKEMELAKQKEQEQAELDAAAGKTE